MSYAQWKITADPQDCLNRIKKSVQKRILRKSIKAGAKPMIAQIKSSVPRFSGATKAAISIKMREYKNSVLGVVGARTSYSKERWGRKFRPSKYLHLIETGKKGFPGLHFMENAFNAHKAQYLETVRKTVEEGVAKELYKKTK